MTVSAFAPAKVNLTLHVTGQRPDGYHLLDSLVAFAGVGDHITASPSNALSLRVSGPRAAGVPVDDSNLVLKAARLFGADRGAALHLEKHLPAAAGIGGGSSDAAAALRALSELWKAAPPKDTSALGADVPVCMAPTAQRMQGIGELLSPVDLPTLPAVLINPGIDVPTPAVFQALSSKTNPPMPDLPRFSGPRDVIAWVAVQRNDLEAPAIAQAPVIAEVLESLQDAPFARMSGSGATCFGLFETMDAANAAAKRIAVARPDWWVQPTRLS